MNALEHLLIFSHGLPCPLEVVVFIHLVHAAVGQNTAFHTIDRKRRPFVFLTHGKTVLAGIFLDGGGIYLQAELRGHFQGIGNLQLAVEQCLISRAPLEKIERVLSKDLGLAQCSQWLMHHLPNAALIPTDSTAAAVMKAAEDESAAAIASAVAAEIHGVPVVEKGIQNRPENYTRFFVIGKKPNPPCSSCEEKTSLVVSIKNEPGSLLKMLEPFSKRGIDLVSIESRPSRRRAWEYLFFIDLIGSWDAPDLRDAVAELERRSIFVKHLGSYPNLKN